MMRKYFILLIAIVIVITSIPYTATYANCSMCDMSKAKKGEVINKTCPVMGGKVSKDTQYKAVHKGKTIGFCCAGCVDAFKANPDKYLKNIEKEG